MNSLVLIGLIVLWWILVLPKRSTRRELVRACDVNRCQSPARVILEFDMTGWTRTIYVCEHHLVPVIYKDGAELLERPDRRREIRPTTLTIREFPAADRAALLEAAQHLEGS